jgi:hypothetical protein
MRIVVDTSTVIAVVAGEAEKTIRSEPPLKTSPFEVRSVKFPITKLDILEAIRESLERF